MHGSTSADNGTKIQQKYNAVQETDLARGIAAKTLAKNILGRWSTDFGQSVLNLYAHCYKIEMLCLQ